MSLKFTSLLAVAGALLLASGAQAQQAPATLSASGVAQAKVTPENKKSETSIRAAIEAARLEALPAAIANAKQRAQELATAGGVTLGALTALSDSSGQQNYFGGYIYGSFGIDKYCGKVANTKSVTRNGRRVRVRTKGTHRVCRYPRTLYATATVTYAITG